MRAFWDLVALGAVATGLVLGVPAAAGAQDEAQGEDQGDATCAMCHSSPAMFEGLPNPQRLVVTREDLTGVHAQLGMSCVSCHQDLEGAEFPHPSELAPAACGSCHTDVETVYEGSIHGYALARGNQRAPTCASCHGSHNILPSSDPRSPTHKVRLPATCASCHGTAGLLTDQLVKLPQSFTDYAQSVHGQGAERGIATAASCSDCHGVHNLKGSVDPASTINPLNVASTCGQCHPDIQLEYEKSIHGRALEIGVRDSPTCTDCHGEHLILSPRNPDAKTYAAQLATETCGQCHDDPVIIAKYNLQGDVVGTYLDSYHGWAAQRAGELNVATCVSCHTAHSVLPAADSASTVNPANVIETCAQCHPDASQRFAASYTHEATSLMGNPVNRTIRAIYLVVIAVIIGVMVVHNLLIMNYFMVERRKELQGSRWVLRFDRSQIIQHLLLTIAFVVLVITGFALRFPDAWWVEWLTGLGMREEVRADLHRIFAVVLVITAAYHMYYIFVTRRGREEFGSIIPRWQDVKDMYNNLRYYTWKSDREVKFGRYDYSQKAEYWALIWGTILMIITGFMLWFPQWTVKVLPSWIIPAAQTVHYYEAWLATLAILVWHFFFVIFHPEEYPMSWTWLTGRMSEESVKRHHARWFESEIARSRGAASGSPPPVPTGGRTYAPNAEAEKEENAR